MAELFKNNTISPLYEATLQDHHKHKHWGGTGFKWGGPTVERILNWKRYHIDTALDYGCGQESMKANFPQIKWSGYDPGIPEKATKPEGQFDLVINTDVMEHVEGEYIDAVLQEIVDYAKQVAYIEIACAPANDKFQSGPRAGQDVHISVHPPQWWEDKIRALKGIHVQDTHHMGSQIRGQWRERAKFIIEKL